MVVVVVVVVVEIGLGGGKLKESRASATQGSDIHTVGCRQGLPRLHKLLHVSLPRLTP